jgi:hypothetical protein
MHYMSKQRRPPFDGPWRRGDRKIAGLGFAGYRSSRQRVGFPA